MTTTMKTYCKEARNGLIETHSNIHQIIRELREIQGKLKEMREHPCVHPIAESDLVSLINNLNDYGRTLIALQIDLNEMFPEVLSKGKLNLAGLEIDVITKKIILPEKIEVEKVNTEKVDEVVTTGG